MRGEFDYQYNFRPCIYMHIHAFLTFAVAQRVAAERGETLGKSAGFQIRLENKLPRSCGSVLYCTTGILLRRLIGDP